MAKIRKAVMDIMKGNEHVARVILTLDHPADRASYGIAVFVDVEYAVQTENGRPTEEQWEVLMDVWEMLAEISTSIHPKPWEALSITDRGCKRWLFYLGDPDVFVQKMFSKQFPIALKVTVEEDPEWLYWQEYGPGLADKESK